MSLISEGCRVYRLAGKTDKTQLKNIHKIQQRYSDAAMEIREPDRTISGRGIMVRTVLVPVIASAWKSNGPPGCGLGSHSVLLFTIWSGFLNHHILLKG